jgi:hypothetical protein
MRSSCKRAPTNIFPCCVYNLGAMSGRDYRRTSVAALLLLKVLQLPDPVQPPIESTQVRRAAPFMAPFGEEVVEFDTHLKSVDVLPSIGPIQELHETARIRHAAFPAPPIETTLPRPRHVPSLSKDGTAYEKRVSPTAASTTAASMTAASTTAASTTAASPSPSLLPSESMYGSPNPALRGSLVAVDASNNMVIAYTYKSGTHEVRARADMPASMLYLLFSGIVHRPFTIRVNDTVLSNESAYTVETVLGASSATVSIEEDASPNGYIKLAQFIKNEALKSIPLEKTAFASFYTKLKTTDAEAVELLRATFESSDANQISEKLKTIALGSRPIGRGFGGCVFCPAIPSCAASERMRSNLAVLDVDTCVSKFFGDREVFKVPIVDGEFIPEENAEVLKEYDASKVISDLDDNSNLRFTAKPLAVCTVEPAQVPFEYYATACDIGNNPAGKRNIPKFQLISEYGGLGYRKMITLTNGNIRMLAIALYPLFYGFSVLSARGLYIPDNTHADNIVYNVKTQRFVFIDYASDQTGSDTDKLACNAHLASFIRNFAQTLVKQCQNYLYAADKTEAAALNAKFIELYNMCRKHELTAQAPAVLQDYESFLWVTYAYTPPPIQVPDKAARVAPLSKTKYVAADTRSSSPLDWARPSAGVLLEPSISLPTASVKSVGNPGRLKHKETSNSPVVTSSIVDTVANLPQYVLLDFSVTLVNRQVSKDVGTEYVVCTLNSRDAVMGVAVATHSADNASTCVISILKAQDIDGVNMLLNAVYETARSLWMIYTQNESGGWEQRHVGVRLYDADEAVLKMLTTWTLSDAKSLQKISPPVSVATDNTPKALSADKRKIRFDSLVKHQEYDKLNTPTDADIESDSLPTYTGIEKNRSQFVGRTNSGHENAKIGCEMIVCFKKANAHVLLDAMSDPDLCQKSTYLADSIQSKFGDERLTSQAHRKPSSKEPTTYDENARYWGIVTKDRIYGNSGVEDVCAVAVTRYGLSAGGSTQKLLAKYGLSRQPLQLHIEFLCWRKQTSQDKLRELLQEIENHALRHNAHHVWTQLTPEEEPQRILLKSIGYVHVPEKSSRQAAFYTKTLVVNPAAASAQPAASSAAASATLYRVPAQDLSPALPSTASESAYTERASAGASMRTVTHSYPSTTARLTAASTIAASMTANTNPARSRLLVDASNNMPITYTYKETKGIVRARADMPASMLYLLFSGIVHRPFTIKVNGTVLSHTSTETVANVLGNASATVSIEEDKPPEGIKLKQFKHMPKLEYIPLETTEFAAFYSTLAVADDKTALTQLQQTLGTTDVKEMLLKLQKIAVGSRPIGWGANGCVFCPAVASCLTTGPLRGDSKFDTSKCVSKFFPYEELAIGEFDNSRNIFQYDTLENCRFTAKVLAVCAISPDLVPFEYFSSSCKKKNTLGAAETNPPTHQLISEFGGLSMSDMLKLNTGNTRTFAIALYPLFYGFSVLSAHKFALSDNTHSNNVVYNVRTQRFVFIDYAAHSMSDIEDMNQSLRIFINVVCLKSLLDLHGVREASALSAPAAELYTLYQQLRTAAREDSKAQAPEVLNLYRQFLVEKFAFRPPS